MTKSLNPALLMFCAALCSVLAGCAFLDPLDPLDPYLDKAVGQRTSDIKYPQLKYQKLMREDGSRAVIQYSLSSLWRCRWIFEIEKDSGIVKAWRYPDPEATNWCRHLPSSMP